MLDDVSSSYCGIITEFGLYKMRRLPFGLRNGPSIFQRIMNKIFHDLKNVTIYIDDILIHTNTFAEHIDALECVFARINKFGLKLKAEKCKFFKKNCKFLGHEISSRGYEPAISNCESIKNFPVPKNIREVKRFLGMCSFFRKFISNFASIAAPLNMLTRGKEPTFVWNKCEDDAFHILKNKLSEKPCLQSPDFNLPFYLFTDASAIAYGAALFQSRNKIDLYSVGYWSRTLSVAEAKFPPTHGELAAIFHAINHFKSIIYGSKLIVLTDHRPLTFLMKKASTNVKLNRWLLGIQEVSPQ